MKKSLLLVVITFLTCYSFSQTNKEPVRVTDMLKIKSISGINLSKDGSKAVFTVATIEQDENSKWDYSYKNQIWMVDADGKSVPKQLTTKEGSSQADWSPDGKQIAFVRLADGKPQIFLLSLDGGEAMQLTRFKYGAGTPKWSPDGKQILFSSNIPLKDLLKDSLLNPSRSFPPWPAEKPGMTKSDQFRSPAVKADPDGSIDEIRAYLDSNAEDKKAKVLERLNFQDESGVNTEMSFNHFFIIDVNAPQKPTQLTKGFFQFNYADFTPDGKRVILEGNIDSMEHPDRALETEIFTVSTNGTDLKEILGGKGLSYSSPLISPSGKWLAFQYNTTASLGIPTFAIIPFAGSLNEKIDIPFDREADNSVWSTDERFIYFNAQSNGGEPVYRVDVTTKKIEQLSDYSSGIVSFDVSGDKLVFVKTEVSDPFEVYISDAECKNEKRVSYFNYSWVQAKQLSLPEKRTFTNSKGMTIEYWVMKPANYEAGKKYPLLLEIHGGPMAMWGPGETTMWHEYQFFCSKGYGVVYCNPRGSGGYGLDFLRANINDWGAGPSSDVLAALDKTVASEKWVDTSKLVVTGGSYAGYLVAWIISHDHRFKAACSQRGVYDLATFFGEGNAWRLVQYYFGGYPWEATTKATLERESPITYVQYITTPYIIFHGENDRRTGTTQGEMMYRSLKVLGRPVEYVRHPGATHEITRSGNNRQRIDQMLRTYEFFERWLNKKSF